AAVAGAVTAALDRGGAQGTEDPAAEDAASDVGEVEVAVRYDGPDLDDVGRLTGLLAPGVVEAHSSTRWVVAFAGFAPGFCYLVDADRGEQSPLAVPRRDEPRTSVPAGAVGLAGEFSGVYPRSSPGGWQLIGTTSARLWDLDRDPPALLQPGGRVRFVDEGGSAGGVSEAPA
ncbi:MAG: carboxyltransferase domain-containing protein, partial [Actinomycetota bacterium]|nr:carboxyltransferase domain-containing protein [Actinomycetota bacterium]